MATAEEKNALRDNAQNALATSVPDAVAALKQLATSGNSEQVKLDAATALLDRGISAAKGFSG